MKVLIIRFSSIGDIVLTSPVARLLQQQLGAEVHFLTKSNFAGIVADNPHIAQVHTLGTTLGATAAVLRPLAFDLVIDLHSNLRSKAICFLLGRPTKRFNKLNVAKWLLVQFKINVLPSTHIVDRYLATVVHLGIQNDGQGLDYFIPQEKYVALSSLKEQYPQWQCVENQSFIAVVLGAAHATKQLPEEKLLEIIPHLKHPVVLLGGPAEADLGARLAQKLGNTVLNTCGSLSLQGSASLLQQCSGVVTPDTGLMHIAAALRKPIFTVWGSTVPAFGMYAYLPSNKPLPVQIQVAGLSCQPCSKIGFAKCPKGHFDCMRKIEFPWHEI